MLRQLPASTETAGLGDRGLTNPHQDRRPVGARSGGQQATVERERAGLTAAEGSSRRRGTQPSVRPHRDLDAARRGGTGRSVPDPRNSSHVVHIAWRICALSTTFAGSGAKAADPAGLQCPYRFSRAVAHTRRHEGRG